MTPDVTLSQNFLSKLGKFSCIAILFEILFEALPRKALPRKVLPRKALPRKALPHKALPRKALPRLWLTNIVYYCRFIS